MIYEADQQLQRTAEDIISRLNLRHIKPGRVACIRSHGSKSRRTLARIHSTPKIIQKALGMDAFYVIEFVSENFDRLSGEDKIKTIMHELLHIPQGFGGGFRHHRPFVNRKNVETFFCAYKKSLQL